MAGNMQQKPVLCQMLHLLGTACKALRLFPPPLLSEAGCRPCTLEVSDRDAPTTRAAGDCSVSWMCSTVFRGCGCVLTTTGWPRRRRNPLLPVAAAMGPAAASFLPLPPCACTRCCCVSQAGMQEHAQGNMCMRRFARQWGLPVSHMLKGLANWQKEVSKDAHQAPAEPIALLLRHLPCSLQETDMVTSGLTMCKQLTEPCVSGAFGVWVCKQDVAVT